MYTNEIGVVFLITKFDPQRGPIPNIAIARPNKGPTVYYTKKLQRTDCLQNVKIFAKIMSKLSKAIV